MDLADFCPQMPFVFRRSAHHCPHRKMCSLILLCCWGNLPRRILYVWSGTPNRRNNLLCIFKVERNCRKDSQTPLSQAAQHELTGILTNCTENSSPNKSFTAAYCCSHSKKIEHVSDNLANVVLQWVYFHHSFQTRSRQTSAAATAFLINPSNYKYGHQLSFRKLSFTTKWRLTGLYFSPQTRIAQTEPGLNDFG